MRLTIPEGLEQRGLILSRGGFTFARVKVLGGAVYPAEGIVVSSATVDGGALRFCATPEELFPDPAQIPEEGVNLWELGASTFTALPDVEMPGESKRFLVMAGASPGDARARAEHGGYASEIGLFVSPNEIRVSPGAINLGHPDSPEPPSEVALTLVEDTAAGSSGAVLTGGAAADGMTQVDSRFAATLTSVSDDLRTMAIKLAASPGTAPSALILATEVRCRYNNRQKKSHMVLGAQLFADRAWVESTTGSWVRGVPEEVRLWDEYRMRVVWVGRETEVRRIWGFLPMLFLRPAPDEGWVMRADALADDAIERLDAAGQWLPFGTGYLNAVGLEKVADLPLWPLARIATYGPLTWRGSRLGGPVVFRYEFFPLELKPPSERETAVIGRDRADIAADTNGDGAIGGPGDETKDLDPGLLLFEGAPRQPVAIRVPEDLAEATEGVVEVERSDDLNADLYEAPEGGESLFGGGRFIRWRLAREAERENFRSIVGGRYLWAAAPATGKPPTAFTLRTPAAGEDTLTVRLIRPAVTLEELEFATDYDVLKDNAADWTDAGAVFPEPKWKRGRAESYPVVHRMGGRIGLRAKVALDLPDFLANLKTAGLYLALALDGDGPVNALDFSGVGGAVSVAEAAGGVEMVVEATALDPLAAEIDKLAEKSISWKMRLALGRQTVEIDLDASGPHTIYQVYGAPITQNNPCTVKRIEWCTAVDAGTDTLNEIAVAIRHKTKEGTYFKTGLHAVDPIWLVLLNDYDHRVDCLRAAQLAVAALWLLGVPGVTEDLAHATTDTDASNLEYPLTTCPNHGAVVLRWASSGVPPNTAYLNDFEGCFKIDLGGGNYSFYSVHPETGPAASEFELMHLIKALYAGFGQWWSYTAADGTRYPDMDTFPGRVLLPALPPPPPPPPPPLPPVP